MYYDDSFLTKILNINGISGFEGIYVSSDYGYNKGNGLWSIVCNNIKGNVLHIGDNYFKDGLSCVNFGIDTFIVESAVNCALESPYRNLMGMTNNIDEDNLIGLIISKVYNSPFVANNYIIENIKDFSYIFISPLVTGFMIWLLNEVKNNNYNNVLFASRDGYIISKLYNRVRKNGKYFYTSRKCAATTSYENINYINKWFPIYNANFMLSDFNNEQAEKNRNNYIKYLKNNNIYNEGVYAFVDLNSRGTTQFFFEFYI